MRLSDTEIADLRARSSIEEVVRGVGGALRRRGARVSGPCPLCGGSARSARFEIKRAGTPDEAFVCAVCAEGGDVIRLVQLLERCDFRGAVERLGGVVSFSAEEAARRQREAEAARAQREAEAAQYREAERRRCLAIWRATLPPEGTPVAAYLAARGLDDHQSFRVRFAPELAYFDGESEDERGRKAPRVVHRGPAMVAPILDGAAVFRGVHLTWIDPERPGRKAEIFSPDDGERLPAKKMRGIKSGGYVDALPGGDPRKVYLGEGIESVASVRTRMGDGAVYRVAGDLGNLAGACAVTVDHPTLKTATGRARRVPGPEPDFDAPACPVPAVCRELVLLKDGDSDAFLTDMAMLRAAARHRQAGRTIRCADPGAGVDFNDLLRGAA